MYVLLILVLCAIALGTIYSGHMKGSKGRVWAGLLFLLSIPLFFVLLSFWGEMLWFDSLGFGSRFWKVVWTRAGSSLAGGILGALILYLWTLPSHGKRRSGPWLLGIGAAIGAVWGGSSWQVILIYLHRVSVGLADPILEKDIGFYLFILPFYDRVFGFLLSLGSVALLACLGAALARARIHRRLALVLDREKLAQREPELRVALGGLFLLLTWGSCLFTYHLMYSTLGVVTGAGWTDVHLRMPAAYILAGLAFLLGVWTLVPLASGRREGAAGDYQSRRKKLLAPPCILIGGWILGIYLVPALIQWLRVEPNEITFERPYIEYNIRFTRQGFGLDRIEERQFPAAGDFTQATIDHNRQLLSEVRLWDWRALRAVHKQFQEIRLYYEFSDVDVDRYAIGGQPRQVMISTREMLPSALPPQSRTFVNERIKYTHGYGITMTPVSEFTREGLPNFLIKDIPPKSSFPELQVTRPEIYFGELTRSHVLVNTSEPEFDYPRGDSNEYVRYAGTGGVALENFWRKFVFGWKFDGTRLLLSSYLRPESRIMFYRQIEERVRRVAPFLRLDHDPYIVLVDGKLYWILDAYTVSSRYPYSRPFSSHEVIEYAEGSPHRITSVVAAELDGTNYVRNSVKAVVDAYDGGVTLYVFDPRDPVLRVWQNAFPGLFRSREQMPSALQAHIRYPADMLLAQGLIYERYHMGDPQVFYNQEDLWVRATEKYYSAVQPIEPYYVMWKMPDSGKAEYVLILPFTPKNRQVMIGWIAGTCDPDRYGQILAYKFPKEKQVLGPQQMETKIDQDRFLSGQLTLWDQHGSRVIRGDVLVIPIDDTLLYVEPIYLQAETAAYPELRLVAVMHGQKLSYAPSFAEALRGLLPETPQVSPSPEITPSGGLTELARKANDAFEQYLRLQAEQRFGEAAHQLEILKDVLRQMIAVKH